MRIAETSISLIFSTRRNDDKYDVTLLKFVFQHLRPLLQRPLQFRTAMFAVGAPVERKTYPHSVGHGSDVGVSFGMHRTTPRRER
jgi:hypothetical protein